MFGDLLQVAVALRGRGRGHLLGTAVARGGTMTAASGWRSTTPAWTRSWSYPPLPVNEATTLAWWHKFQHRRSVASDRRDDVGLASLEAAILSGGRLAARSLMWHSSFEEAQRGGL